MWESVEQVVYICVLVTYASYLKIVGLVYLFFREAIPSNNTKFKLDIPLNTRENQLFVNRSL